jgi:hypothetical protein
VGGAEIIPVKNSHTRIKPLALVSGHGHYTTVTPERTLVSVGEWPLHIAVIRSNSNQRDCHATKGQAYNLVRKYTYDRQKAESNITGGVAEEAGGGCLDVLPGWPYLTKNNQS